MIQSIVTIAKNNSLNIEKALKLAEKLCENNVDYVWAERYDTLDGSKYFLYVTNTHYSQQFLKAYQDANFDN